MGPVSTKIELKSLYYIAFIGSVSSIRNDGVTGSNPVSGTTTSTKKIRNIRRKGLPQMTVNLSFWRHFQLEIASDPRWAQLDDE